MLNSLPNSDGFIEFDIRSNDDLKRMQEEMNSEGVSPQKQYIASEMAMNMLEHGQGGLIRINGVCVESAIRRGWNRQQMKDLAEKIENARTMVRSGTPGKLSQKSNGGIGLMTIMHSGWHIGTPTLRGRSMVISAVKMST